ncbi:MAG: tetratricopeptide repeat protein [Bryobacteraceae bacterium]
MIGSTGLRFSGALAWVCASVLGAPAAASAADKDVVELQRQVAVLTDKVNSLQTALNSLQSAVDQKLGAQGSLLQQIHTENAAAAKTVADQLSQQEQKVAVPVAALNAKIDQMIAAFAATQDNIGDMNSRLGRLEQQIVDMRNVVKVLQAGPPPAPSAPQTPGGPPPGVTAQGLFQDASRDQLSGKSDLALQEYTDYLKYFGDTETAAGAQFHIGEILLTQGNADHAIQAFDAVAGQYPKSGKAPDALYLKAQALKKEGQRAEATQVLRDLVRLYPDSDAAGRAKTDLTAPPRAPKK